MKVLIAEDEAVLRNLLVKAVQRWGFEAVGVENGKKALQLLQASAPPQIVILEWNMPEMNGLVTLRNIRCRKEIRETYVLLLTTEDDILSVERAIGARVDDYILKPFDREDIRARLEKARQHVQQLQLCDVSLEPSGIRQPQRA